MQKTCLFPQEKFSDPEKILSAKKHGLNLDKKGLILQKKNWVQTIFLERIKLIWI